MIEITIRPRFCDTDALGHINNTVFPVWLLEGREPVAQQIAPNITGSDSTVVLARQELDFQAECFFGKDVTVRTWIAQLGNSSVHLAQEIWQDGTRCVKARSILVHIDQVSRKSTSLLPERRAQLEKLMEEPK